MSKQGFVTISVDDGHPSDLRTLELLQKFGLRATFYVPAQNPERAVMTKGEIQQVAQYAEIGGHGMHNLRLDRMSEPAAWMEVAGGKRWLEDAIGSAVVAFCYPSGKFTPSLISLVRRAGFLGARTCMFNRTDMPRDPYRWGVSTHAFSHRPLIQLRHALLETNLGGAWNFLRVCRGSRDWQTQFMCALDYVESHGGVAHLYMHSWEIDERREWNKLSKVFQAISGRESLCRVTNGELFRRHPAIAETVTAPQPVSSSAA